MLHTLRIYIIPRERISKEIRVRKVRKGKIMIRKKNKTKDLEGRWSWNVPGEAALWKMGKGPTKSCYLPLGFSDT